MGLFGKFVALNEKKEERRECVAENKAFPLFLLMNYARGRGNCECDERCRDKTLSLEYNGLTKDARFY